MALSDGDGSAAPNSRRILTKSQRDTQENRRRMSTLLPNDEKPTTNISRWCGRKRTGSQKRRQADNKMKQRHETQSRLQVQAKHWRKRAIEAESLVDEFAAMPHWNRQTLENRRRLMNLGHEGPESDVEEHFADFSSTPTSPFDPERDIDDILCGRTVPEFLIDEPKISLRPRLSELHVLA